MRKIDRSPWPPGAAPPRRHRLAAPPATSPEAPSAGAGRDELERWLCEPATPAPSLDELACAFGLSLDDAGDAEAAGSRGRMPGPERLRFALAVLRDAFPEDGAVRRWMRTPSAEGGGERPLDLLVGGRVERLEELAVGEWNRRGRAAHA